METDIRKKYSVRAKEIPSPPDYWSTLEVAVFLNRRGVREQIGSYKRNYPSLFHTFCPFKKNEKEFALYSPHYTCTRILSLPECKDIGGEEPSGNGFCPVDYYVPLIKKTIHKYKPSKSKKADELDCWLVDDECFDDEQLAGALKIRRTNSASSGFVAGCVWGDDAFGWKIQYLDLSSAHRGILKRDDRFGYIYLPQNLRLKKAITFSDFNPKNLIATIAHSENWNIKLKQKLKY